MFCHPNYHFLILRWNQKVNQWYAEKAMTSSTLDSTFTAFCQVLDNRLQPIGITTQLSPHTLCLSLPKAFSSQSLFSITLKRVDVYPALTIKLVVSVQESQARNEEFDDITVKIENPEAFQTFFTYCQTAKTDGLWDRSGVGEIQPLSYQENSWDKCTRVLSHVSVNTWQKLGAMVQQVKLNQLSQACALVK